MNPTPSRRGRMLTWSVLAVATVTLTSCTSSKKNSSPTPGPPSSPSATTVPERTPEELVDQLQLSAADLPQGETTKLIDGGDQVDGQVTLDNCGFTFTTEAHRVARRQVAILSAQGKVTGVANEVVAYDSEAQAANALVEFRRSITACPRNLYQASTVAGVPDLRYSVSTQTTDTGLPVADNTDAAIAVTAKGSSQRIYGILIFQRRGTVLDGVYLQSPTAPTPAVVASVHALAQTAGTKLAAT